MWYLYQWFFNSYNHNSSFVYFSYPIFFFRKHKKTACSLNTYLFNVTTAKTELAEKAKTIKEKNIENLQDLAEVSKYGYNDLLKCSFERSSSLKGWEAILCKTMFFFFRNSQFIITEALNLSTKSQQPVPREEGPWAKVTPKKFVVCLQMKCSGWKIMYKYTSLSLNYLAKIAQIVPKVMKLQSCHALEAV